MVIPIFSQHVPMKSYEKLQVERIVPRFFQRVLPLESRRKTRLQHGGARPEQDPEDREGKGLEPGSRTNGC